MRRQFYIGIICSVFFSGVVQGSNSCLDMHVIQNAPLAYYDKENKLVGMHTELLEEISTLSGICINIHLMPYARIWKSIENGGHDGGIVFRTPERSHLVEYVALIKHFKTVVIPLSSRQIRTYDDLSNLVIGKTRGTRLGDKFDNDERFILLEVTNYKQAINMLNLGRIDAVAGSALVLSYQLSQNNIPQASIDPTNHYVIGEREQWLQLSKHSKNKVDTKKLQNAVKLMIDNGTLDNIMTKYYGGNWRAVNQ
ncbi:MAG: transporter substrate-binding domain-containing protein [Paraglaciecola sp.]|nr:transporter substrate-binding domain-containing protein [Paraglaciecola sp.]